jgi:hypothetical protein
MFWEGKKKKLTVGRKRKKELGRKKGINDWERKKKESTLADNREF